MKTKYENKQLLLNVNLRGNKKGSAIKVAVDKSGIPIDRYWRDRLKDAKIDNCVEFVNDISAEEEEFMNSTDEAEENSSDEE